MCFGGSGVDGSVGDGKGEGCGYRFNPMARRESNGVMVLFRKEGGYYEDLGCGITMYRGVPVGYKYFRFKLNYVMSSYSPYQLIFNAVGIKEDEC